VSHVEVDPAGVSQKSAVSRRLIVASMVKIQHPTALDMEDVIAKFVRKPGGRMIRPLLLD
jgi:hypothetical protein